MNIENELSGQKRYWIEKKEVKSYGGKVFINTCIVSKNGVLSVNYGSNNRELSIFDLLNTIENLNENIRKRDKQIAMQSKNINMIRDIVSPGWGEDNDFNY